MRTQRRIRSAVLIALVFSLLLGALQTSPSLAVASASLPEGAPSPHNPLILAGDSPQAMATLSGTVTDGSGHGWPLYAEVTIAHPPDLSTTVFTDPLTGHYAATLPAGVTYNAYVFAWGGGYHLASRTVALGAEDIVLDWALQRNAADCIAPGYGPTYVYHQDFEASDGGYQVDGYSSWEWGVPTSGPGSAHSGARAWATGLGGPYMNGESGYITSPVIDLSPYAGQSLAISWWQSLMTESGYDNCVLEVSGDGGAAWSTVYGPWSGQLEPNWNNHVLWLDSAFVTQTFRLRFGFFADGSVTYPGYYIDDVGVLTAPRVIYQTQDFEQSNGGYTVSGRSSWAWGAPSGTPRAAHSGRKVWATNLTGEYGNNEDGYLISPPIDMSAQAGQPIVLSWWQVLILEKDYDQAKVEVSADGGASWDLVYGPASGLVDAEWTRREVVLEPRYSVSGLRVRFGLRSDTSVTKAGFAIDDVQLQPQQDVPVMPCDVQPGGLVAGFVRDANTGAGLVGAVVQPDRGQSGQTFSTPVDRALEEGWYRLFAPAGARALTARGSAGYGQDTRSVTVVENRVASLDLALPAGRLAPEPAAIEIEVEPNARGAAVFKLTNQGGLPASFELLAEEVQAFSGGRFDAVPPVADLKQHKAVDASGLGRPRARERASLDAVRVVQQWPTGLPEAWGIACDLDRPGVWVSSPGPSWNGTDTLYRFTRAGQLTSVQYPYSWYHDSGPADLTYDSDADMLWVMNVGDYDNCIFEMDPHAGYTGRSICPFGTGFSVSQRGLAYDPDTDTFFAGGWNDNTIYRFDRSGNVVEQAYVGLAIAGLAYNPTNGHLWVTENGGANDLTLLDAKNGYATLETWAVPGWVLYSGAGLEIDCDGHLWVVDHQARVVQELDVGEPGLISCQPPWITVSPSTGMLASGASQAITVNVDATVPEANEPGWHRASLRIYNNTPYTLSVPVGMFVMPPITWGELKGQVTGLGYCDIALGALSGATVQVQGRAGNTWTLVTDDEGRYDLWLDSKLGPVTLTFSFEGYQTEVLTDVDIAGGRASTVRDVSLRQPKSCFRSRLPILAR